MHITLRERGKAVILDVEGQVTFETGQGLRDQLHTAMEKAEVAVVINLQEVKYLDSSGIAVLVEGLKATLAGKVAVGLYGLSPSVRNVIELVRLDKILNLYEDEEEALRELACPLPD